MDIAHPDMQIALRIPAGFRSAPVMRAIGIAENMLHMHIGHLDAQVAAQAATIAALRAEAVRKDARIDAMSAALRKVNAPPCPAGQFEHAYTHHELGELECHIEWEPEAPEAGWPEEVTLMAAYLCGRGFTERLSPDEVERIQIAAAASRNQARAAMEPA